MAGKTPAAIRARRLRRDETDAEKKLWSLLRNRAIEVKFRRQQPIGPFIVDFCCLEPKLVIEVDGGQHAERAIDDERRSEFLRRCGYRVIRFWNHEVLQDTDSVIEQIVVAVEEARRGNLVEDT